MAALLTAGAVIGAHASTVTLGNITGLWYDATPGSSITSNTGESSFAQIAWDGSGYDFAASSGVDIDVPPSPSSSFSLGSFSHVNEPTSFSINATKLQVSADVFVDGVSAGRKSFDFQFTHDETNNGGSTCPYGGANGQGVNINGCADRVGVSFIDSSDSFLIGTELYTLDILGFQTASGFVDSFLTAERMTNTADLVANVSLRSQVSPVPEPAPLALMAGGLMVVGWRARRRQR